MQRFILPLTALIFLISCNRMTISDFPGGDDICLGWQFIENHPDGNHYSAQFILENRSEKLLPNQGWTLYFNQQGNGVIQESVTGHVRIEHVNGDLMRITPGKKFRLEPGESVQISYQNPGWLLKESEAPLGPYLVYEPEAGDRPVVMAIQDYQILPFPSLEKFYPAASHIPLPDAGWTYDQNRDMVLREPAQAGVIIPTPLKAVYSERRVTMEEKIEIHFTGGLGREAGYLADMLEQASGMAPIVKEDSRGGNCIILLEMDQQKVPGNEAYRLSVNTRNGVRITGSNAAGVFYGIQSLLAMLPPDIWAHPGSILELPEVTISDKPAFAYRGFHLDVARNFIEPGAIMKLISVMSFYKLNKLHLHLTDDEGWRLEIPSFPELTEVGGHRGQTKDSKDHLIPAYGSGPDPNPGSSHGSGYFSRETFIDILKFADAHHIEVIPEVNFPGHARAAIYAMEARYDRLMAEGKNEEAEMYRLIDPEDASKYNSAQNFHDNVVCVCREAPYLFFEKVVDEIKAMYSEAGLTLETLHTGGDEVPQGAWTQSPECNAFLTDHPEIGGVENLQAYFEGRLFEILEKKELVMAGWEEIAMKKSEDGDWMPNPEFVGEAILPYVWNSLGDNLDLGNRLANTGFPVILCNVNNFYFDLAYSHHPAERGLYWGGFVSTRNAFNFTPYHVFACNLTDKWGNPGNPAVDFKGMEQLKRAAYPNIKGLQAELWSETVKGGEMAEYYYLPKMIGFAERTWSGEPVWGNIVSRRQREATMQRAWNRFANVIGQREMPRLDYLFGGFNYRLPPPGAMIRDGKLFANINYPGLAIRYSTDGSEPGMQDSLYSLPVEVNGQVRLRSFDTRGRGSRITEVNF